MFLLLPLLLLSFFALVFRTCHVLYGEIFPQAHHEIRKMGNRMWCLISLIPFDFPLGAGLGDELQRESFSLQHRRQMVRGRVNDEMKCFSV